MANDEEDELDYVSQFACIEAMHMHCMNSFNRIRCQFWILHSQYNQWMINIIYHLQTYKFDQIYIHCWAISVRRWHILDHKPRQAPHSQTVQCALLACARDVRVCDRIPASCQTIWLPWVQGISNKPFNGEFETQRIPLKSISIICRFKDSWINSNNHFHNHFPETILSLCFHHRSEHPWPFWIDALRASSHFPGSLSTLSVEIPGELHEMDALDVRASMEVFETWWKFLSSCTKKSSKRAAKRKKKMNMAAFLEYKSVSLVPVSTRI